MRHNSGTVSGQRLQERRRPAHHAAGPDAAQRVRGRPQGRDLLPGGRRTVRDAHRAADKELQASPLHPGAAKGGGLLHHGLLPQQLRGAGY